MRRPLRLFTTAILAACALLASCGVPSSGPEAPARPSAQQPTQWPPPAANRPVVDLKFQVADDLHSVTGTEHVTFTPDREICELVFRAWPNKPATANRGNSLTVESATVTAQPVEVKAVSAGAPDGVPGTLVELPLPQCSPAGEPVAAELAFALQLGPGTDERVGVSRDTNLAWFGTAYPLLAWQNGVGWTRDEAVGVDGETVTSEAYQLRSLKVIASERYTVLGTGQRQSTTADKRTGQTTHEFTAPAVRDLTVTVGDVQLLEREVAGTRIHIGAPRNRSHSPPEQWLTEIERSLSQTSAYLGPVPYDDLWVSIIPDQTSGVEFPGAMQIGDVDLHRDRSLVGHEIAHLWFYGLVGNNQAQHPWLDESFASFTQLVVDDPNHDPAPTLDYPRRFKADVGLSMDEWNEFRRPSGSYLNAVYGAGADMLINARRDAGKEKFDRALRHYLHANAHRIATPRNVAAAFKGLPAAMTRMRDAGALPQ